MAGKEVTPSDKKSGGMLSNVFSKPIRLKSGGLIDLVSKSNDKKEDNKDKKSDEGEEPSALSLDDMIALAFVEEDHPRRSKGKSGGQFVKSDSTGSVKTIRHGSLKVRYSTHEHPRIKGSQIPLPNYKQKDDHSCGFVAALTVMHYFDKTISPKEVLKIVRPTKSGGIDRERLQKAFKELGITAEYKDDLTIGQLRNYVAKKMPVLVTLFPEDWSSDHWTAIQGFDEKRIYLSNYKSLSLDDFKREWYDKGEGLVCNQNKPKSLSVEDEEIDNEDQQWLDWVLSDDDTSPPISLSTDSHGHDHASKGSDKGGQFVSKSNIPFPIDRDALEKVRGIWATGERNEEKVKLSDLTATQGRVVEDQEYDEDHDPIEVVRTREGNLYIHEGHNRASAAVGAKKTHIKAIVATERGKSLSIDTTGHLHKGKGEGGGQFTNKSSSDTSSDDDEDDRVDILRKAGLDFKTMENDEAIAVLKKAGASTQGVSKLLRDLKKGKTRNKEAIASPEKKTAESSEPSHTDTTRSLDERVQSLMKAKGLTMDDLNEMPDDQMTELRKELPGTSRNEFFNSLFRINDNKAINSISESDFNKAVLQGGQHAADLLTRRSVDAGNVKAGSNAAEPMKTVHIGNATYQWGEDAVDAVVGTVRDFNANRQKFPKKLLGSMNNIVCTKNANTHDAHFADKYNMPNFKSLATAGDGKNINVYNGEPLAYHYLAHEAGHNFAKKTWNKVAPDEQSEYANAANIEGPVSQYGSKAPEEDFAEAVKAYVHSPTSLLINFPKKYAVIEGMMT